jgi:hypothetical protein
MQSHYYRDKEELKKGFKLLISKIEFSEKTFYLLRSNPNYDMTDAEQIIKEWKSEVKNAC